MGAAAGPNVVEDGLVLALDAGNTKSYSGTGNVSLLLHGDGTNGSTSIVDDSIYNHTITAYGNAQISTTQSKFGGASMYFDGSGDYLASPVSDTLSLGTSDFTIECWAWRLANAPANSVLMQMSNSADIYSALFGFAGAGNFLVYLSSAGSSWDIASGQVLGSIDNETWVHYALTREGSTFRTFKNGVQQSTWTSSASIYQAGNQVRIGAGQPYAVCNYGGYIDDLRITKGLALYTSNFTPPTTALAGPATQWTDMIGSNTGTLVNGVGFDSNNLGSLSFDGTDDYVTISDSEDLEFGSGDFTIEAYIYPTGVPSIYGYACIFAKGAPLQCYFMNTNSLSLFVDSDNSGSPYSIIGNTNITGNNTVNQDEWTHIAICRSGDTWKVFTGGVQRYSATHSGTIFNNTDVFSIGDYAPSSGIYPFQGYISNLKVYKGKALTVAEVQQNYNALKGRYLN